MEVTTAAMTMHGQTWPRFALSGCFFSVVHILWRVRFVVDDEYDMKASAEVPVRWSAPEVLQPPSVYSIKSDVWSYGECHLESLCCFKW